MRPEMKFYPIRKEILFTLLFIAGEIIPSMNFISGLSCKQLKEIDQTPK